MPGVQTELQPKRRRPGLFSMGGSESQSESESEVEWPMRGRLRGAAARGEEVGGRGARACFGFGAQGEGAQIGQRRGIVVYSIHICLVWFLRKYGTPQKN